MAEGSSSLAGQHGAPDDMLSIGWHLTQGQALCTTYAKAAEEAGDRSWARFFEDLAASYEKVRREGADKVRELTGEDGAAERSAWWHPPW